MRLKKLLITAVCVAITAVVITGCGDKSPYTDLVKSYTDAIDMEYAYNLTDELAQYDATYDGKAMAGCCGFRTAGSDYEHACADFLANEMKEIGLTDIEKVPVKVDKWQFDSSSLTMEGTDINFTPASYAQSGTDKDGITAEIVDCGTGFEADYDGVNVKGKIALIGVDQKNEAWIDSYIREANLHGAVATVSYQVGGYGQSSKDIRNIQDVCMEDMMPSVSCTPNEAKKIKQAIKTGNDKCTLKVDNTVDIDGGTSYTVVGKIKGKSSDQQIILSGHYDKYFEGFQDDCSAISCIFSIANAMNKAGYQPENDILVVCHGAEEWGASGSQYDWTTGAWQTIDKAHPKWADKTIAMLNFELCGFAETGMDEGYVVTVPEFNSFVNGFTDSNLAKVVDTGAYKDGIAGSPKRATTMEDGISYRFHGVPYILNGILFEGDDSFTCQKYHTEADNSDTWNEDVMKLNIGQFGGMAIVLDQSPALPLNQTAMGKWLGKTYDEDLAKEAGADSETFNSELETFKTNSADLYDQITDLNAKYEEAYEAEDTDTMAKLREEGKELNKKTLDIFAVTQDDFLAVAASWDVYTRHESAITTLNLLDGAISGCDKKVDWADDAESGALDNAWQLNGATAYSYTEFSVSNCNDVDATYFNKGEEFWGGDKTTQFVNVGEGLRSIALDGDFAKAKSIFQKERTDFLPVLKSEIAREIKGLQKVNGMF